MVTAKRTWGPRDWTAVRRGAIYCAPACGGGCTHAAFKAATAAANALAAKMGSGWKPRVWENLGWHYSVISPCGRWKIHPHHEQRGLAGIAGPIKSVTAFLGHADSSGGLWAETAKTPRAAMTKTWARVQAIINEFGDANQIPRGSK